MCFGYLINNLFLVTSLFLYNIWTQFATVCAKTLEWWCHDIQHNDTQHNDTEHNDTSITKSSIITLSIRG
jgi:hypothetical protein